MAGSLAPACQCPFKRKGKSTMSYPPGPPDDGDPTSDNPTPDPGGPGQPGNGPPPGYEQSPYVQQGQPGYGQAYPPQYPQPGYGQTPTTNGKATASLITGIATMLVSLCCGLGLAGVVAIVLGVKARNEIRSSGGTQGGDGMALGGIITGAIAMVLGLVGLAVIIVAIASGNADYNVDYGNDSNGF